MTPRIYQSNMDIEDSDTETLPRFSLTDMDEFVSRSAASSTPTEDDCLFKKNHHLIEKKTQCSVRWSPQLTDEAIIERRCDIEKALHMKIWYKKMDYASFEVHDFDVFGEFREVFRGARIEQCEEWFVTQRNESLRGLENLDDIFSRQREVRTVRAAVLDEQRRQRSHGSFNMVELAQVAEKAAAQHCEVAHERGKFDEDIVKRLLSRDLKKTKQNSRIDSRTTSSVLSRIKGKGGRKSSGASSRFSTDCESHDNELEDEVSSVFESRSEIGNRDVSKSEMEYIAQLKLEEALKSEAKPKKKRGWFTVRVKKR